MALPSRYGIEKKINSMEGLSAYENGGPGSGNFGHSGRPGEIGGSNKTGSYEQLSGPARTRGEYMQKDASEDCKTEFSDVYGALSDHAYWIADEGGFADGYEARDYEALGDKYAGICDRSQSRGYVTQHDLVEMLKRTRKEAEPYGLIDGSGSTDKMNDFLDRYDMDGKLNSVSDIFENGGKGSGNFGHAGRPGEVGGSSKGGGVDLDHAKEVVKKMGEELRKKSPVRKQDEWFVTLKQIDDEYEKRGKEMEDNAGEVESAIYETGETWTGPKQKALDLVKIGIRTNRDMFDDQEEFLEQTEGLFDDLRDVEGFKAKTVDVYEHPMSASGIVIQEHRKK